jgi:hypothetical protein
MRSALGLLVAQVDPPRLKSVDPSHRADLS